MIHLCNLVHVHVNEQKFMFQIGTVIPMLLTNAFHLSNLLLVFVITLFPPVAQTLLHFLHIKKNTQPAIPEITSWLVCLYNFYPLIV